MQTLLLSLLGVILISAVPLIALIAIKIKQPLLEKITHLLVSFSVGALLGNALLHLVPEAFEEIGDAKIAALFVIIGILIFYTIEQFLRWRHCHEATNEQHQHPVAVINVIGDTVHNFLDGILIFSSFAISPEIGWATVFAVFLHEVPQEIADFGVLLHAKWSIKKILLANLLSASAAVIGVIFGNVLAEIFTSFEAYAVAITAGGFLYIACTDLLPDLHEKGAVVTKERLVQLLLIIIGAAIFWYL